MKTRNSRLLIISIFLAAFGLLCLGGLTGCANIPSGEFQDWTHDGNYGVFTSHYEAHGAKKQSDGKVVIDSYTGSIKVAGGYGPSDTIKGLVIDPKVPPVSVQVLPTK